MPEKFIDALKTIDPEFSIKFIWEPLLLGSALTTDTVMSISPKPLLVLHSDLVLSDEYVKRIKDVLQLTRYQRNLIVCHTKLLKHARSSLLFDKNFKVFEFIEGSLTPDNEQTHTNVNSGIYYFPSRIKNIGFIPRETELTKCQIPLLVKSGEIYASTIDEMRVSVDSFEALEKARASF